MGRVSSHSGYLTSIDAPVEVFPIDQVRARGGAIVADRVHQVVVHLEAAPRRHVTPLGIHIELDRRVGSQHHMHFPAEGGEASAIAMRRDLATGGQAGQHHARHLGRYEFKPRRHRIQNRLHQRLPLGPGRKRVVLRGHGHLVHEFHHDVLRAAQRVEAVGFGLVVAPPAVFIEPCNALLQRSYVEVAQVAKAGGLAVVNVAARVDVGILLRRTGRRTGLRTDGPDARGQRGPRRARTSRGHGSTPPRTASRASAMAPAPAPTTGKVGGGNATRRSTASAG